ncbi:MAG: hypothetical protein IJC39_00695 [Firmicutes bacterium]|nr:hypothetical protein [Bacillota bacterium]
MGNRFSVTENEKKKIPQNISGDIAAKTESKTDLTGSFEETGFSMASRFGNSVMQNAMGMNEQGSGGERTSGFGAGGGTELFSLASSRLMPLNVGDAPVQAKKNKDDKAAAPAPAPAPAAAPKKSGKGAAADPAQPVDPRRAELREKSNKIFGTMGSNLLRAYTGMGFNMGSMGGSGLLSEGTFMPMKVLNAEKNANHLSDLRNGFQGDGRDYFKALNAETASWMLEGGANKEGLTSEEAAVVANYTTAGCADFNGIERSPESYSEGEKEKLMERSNLLSSALNKYTLKSPMQLYRFIDIGGLAAMLGPEGSELNGKSVGSDNDEIIGILSQKAAEGTVLKDAGYMSTTVDPNFRWSGGVLLIIHAPEGTRGAPLMDFSAHSNEREFLLDRGQQMNITNVGMQGDAIAVSVSLIV